MKDLGELLLTRGLITDQQLRRAVERQHQIGGRLGTSLLEIEAVTEEILLQALSELVGVPPATQDDLRSIAADAVELLPAKIAVPNRAIVFRRRPTSADIALLDLGDLTLEDELSFVIGLRLRFHIATELRLLEALATYYDFELPARFRSLSRRLERAPQTPTTPPPAGPARRPAAAPSTPAKPIELSSRSRPFVPRPVEPPAGQAAIPLTSEERAALQSVQPEEEPPAAEEPAPSEVEDSFSERLARAETATAIGQTLLEALSNEFVRVLLFRVSSSRQEISGWLATGAELDLLWFDHYAVGLHQATVFRQLLTLRTLYVGKLDDTPGNAALARCWGGALDHECLLLPIFVRGRLACIAYGDRDSLGVTGVDLVLVQRLAKKAAIAFERCILRRKLQSL